MDWLRRNWVDALMGGLIVAVVGGFLALLLRGGGLFGSRAAPPAPVAAPAPSSASPAPAVTPPPPAPPPAQGSASPAPLEVPELPSSGEISSPNTQPSSPPAVTAAASTAASQSSKPSSTQNPRVSQALNAATTSNPSTSGRAATPRTQAAREPGNYTRSDFLRNYRIATGTYSSATRAESAARKLRALGFPAQAFSSGAAFIVVVGPYARESSARAAFTKLRARNPDAVLYSPGGARERGSQTEQPQPAAPIAPPTGSTSSSPPQQYDAGLAYLQVGAFKNSKSALPLLERLRGSGFKALLRGATDGFVRVLVGPYSAPNLETARRSLGDQGLNAFPVKQ